MKTRSIILTISFALASLFSFAQAKTDAVQFEKIKVWGNCGMCKGHIEKAAKEAGASYAVWNKDTKVLSVKYTASKTSDKQIQESIANAGYDTKDFTANGDAYKKLDECCQYERKTLAVNNTKQMVTSGGSCCDKDEICDKTKCTTANMNCCKNAGIKHSCAKNPTNSCCTK
jgi:mercuric ion binding protein